MLTHEVLRVRNELAQFWQCRSNFWLTLPCHGFGSWERHSSFCVAKDWLQDTGDAIFVHHGRGFTDDPYLGYIELLGVLQAVVIQQDALSEMHFAVTGQKVGENRLGGTGWKEIRKFRNRAAGHPTRKDRHEDGNVLKAVFSRQSMSYDHILMMRETNETREHVTINLDRMLGNYDVEAAVVLQGQFDQLRALFDKGRPTESD